MRVALCKPRAMSLGPSARRISRVACRVPGVVPCVGPGTATGHSDQRGDEPAAHPWQDAIESVRRIEGHLGGAAIGAQNAMKAIFFQAMSSTWATRRRAARDRAGRPARSEHREMLPTLSPAAFVGCVAAYLDAMVSEHDDAVVVRGDLQDYLLACLSPWPHQEPAVRALTEARLAALDGPQRDAIAAVLRILADRGSTDAATARDAWITRGPGAPKSMPS